MANYLKKIFILLFFVITMMAFSPVVNAVEQQTVMGSNGQPIKHYGSDENVMVNATYVMDDTDFRACWVSPLVGDITGYSNKIQYQNQMIDVLEKMEEYGLNAIVYHIRIMNDAFYESEYCNWSTYYNTDPDWDCLPWLIEECHRRGIEFHAWMNPYRVANGAHNLNTLAKNFPSSNMASNPANLLQGTNSVILNPGIPAIREWLVKVCMEVVNNYDVDAIHFDDYFYDAGVDDSDTRALYNPTNMSLGNWRRAQVDDFIEKLSNAIRTFNEANNRRVQLGISPSGVYRADTNKANGFGEVSYDPVTGVVSSDGSRTSTASFQHYDNYLYSDTLKWINEEWIDYIIPQTYWAMDHPNCPYADLMEWWAEVCSYKNVNLYSGIGIYLNTSSTSYGWTTNAKETYNQMMVCNTLNNVDGVCFFKYSNIAAAVNSPSLTPGMKTIWATPSILPEIKTMDALNVGVPQNLKVESVEAGNKLSFNQDEDAKFYVIYRSESPITSYDPELVIDVIGNISVDNIVSYVDVEADLNKTYYYGVREQSYSNTLGTGASVSTENISAGTELNLGEIELLKFSDDIKQGNNSSILFEPFSYPYGGKVKYTVEYWFDEGAKTTVSNFTQKKNFFSVDFKVPNDAKVANATLIIQNEVGKTHKTISVELGESLPNIANFIIPEVLYSGEKAVFVWNNLNVDGATYKIQKSLDSFVWEDIESISGDKYTEVNIRKEIRIDGKGDVYYRILASKDGLTGYSNVIKTNIKGYLGEFEGVKINNKLPEDCYILEEGDKLVVTWNVHTGVSGNANYMNTYSTDYTNWMSLNIYSSSISFNINGGKATLTVPITYRAFKMYIKITGLSDNYQTSMDIFEVYVKMEELFSDEVANYLIVENNAQIKQMGIFK